MAEAGPFRKLFEELEAGRLSRRAFIRRATALGVGLPVVLFVLNSTKAGRASAQEGNPVPPSVGTEGQTRGAGGEVKLLQWQAATHLGTHTGQGTKDQIAASLITEPLMHYAPDASLIPNLVKEVPSLENGLVAQDLTSVTYNLLEGVLWSDGQPFTANDVVFTWRWIMDPENGSTSIESYRPIQVVEALDDLTVKVTFNQPYLGWFIPFTGAFGGGVYPEHVISAGADAYNAFRQNPIGTGPYVVESFAENDQVIYVVNENYREPTKPYFDRVNLKGGGDAASSARAVLQTGDWDTAWNLQVEPAILQDLAQGGKGQVVVVPGLSVERILFNFADPDMEVEGQRAYWREPHPVFTDRAVRQAMSLAADRQTIADQFYQEGEEPTANVMVGIAAFESTNTSWEFNLEAAKQILDEAGWVMDGGVRTKDGKELKFSYSTSINAVRQKTQAVVKQSLGELGIEVQLKQVDAGIFFDSAAGNEQNYGHFYNDLQMYTSSPGDSYPISYMASWYAGPDGSNISQKANQWAGQNIGRYNNPEYDALYDQLIAATDPEQAAQLFIQMNDVVINDYVVIPLVQRAAEVVAVSNTLRLDNFAMGPFESMYWNIANWNRTE